MGEGYTFSIAAVIVGLIIVGLGVIIVKYYNKISDVFPVGNYTRWRLVGFITIGVGFLVITNLPTFVLTKIIEVIIGAR